MQLINPFYSIRYFCERSKNKKIAALVFKAAKQTYKMASINVSSNDTMYLTFRFAGLSADLIVPAAALYAVGMVGVVLNATVLVATVKNSSLRGTANFLIALLCLFEMVHQFGHIFLFVVAISGTNFVSLLTATIFMAPSIFSLNSGLMAMFCAAFDRLLAVAMPFYHLKLHKYAYLLAHLFTCIVYGAFTLNYIFANAIENAENPIPGFIADTIPGIVGYKFFSGAAILCLASACCYLAIFVIIRCKNDVTQQTNTQLLRSMIIILSISIGGYLINLSIYQLFVLFGQLFGCRIRLWQLGFIPSILLNIAAGSNAVVLYFNSTEYRRAFQKEFRALAECFGRKNVPFSNPSQLDHSNAKFQAEQYLFERTERKANPTNSNS